MAYGVRDDTDDPKAQIVPASGVGVVIVQGRSELARSANVLPPLLKRAYEVAGKNVSEDDRYFLIEHAERAAIYKANAAGINLDGATMYGTRFPCSDCARAIVWSGIQRLVLPQGFSGEVRWLPSQRAALRILRESGVRVRYLPPPPDMIA